MGADHARDVMNRVKRMRAVKCEVFGIEKEKACQGEKPREQEQHAPDFVDAFFAHVMKGVILSEAKDLKFFGLWPQNDNGLVV